MRRLASSPRLEPEIQNTFPQNKWYASRRGLTFSSIGQGHRVEVAARSCVTFLKGCVVTGCVDWARLSNRNRMRRQGVEDIKGKTPLVLDQPPKQPRRKLSKAELREQADAAFLAWRRGQKAKDK